MRAEIEAVGPITFARFMERALYEPGLGYYSRSTERTTPRGDFVTAPELHGVFGWTLARVVDEMWRFMERPSPFVIREYGAGSGALLLSLVEGLDKLDSPLLAALRFEPVDQSDQIALIRERAERAGRPALVQAPSEGPFIGVVLANEFVDALPVHRVVARGAVLRELLVSWQDGRFVEIEGELSTPRLGDWFEDRGLRLTDGQRAEVNLQMLDWVDHIGAELERGYALVVDYGAAADRLYDHELRPSGTLRAFASQQVSGDVLGGMGDRDMTAHVDFDALERAARAAGFDVLGRRRAAELLLAAGFDEVYAAARAEADQDWDSALRLRGAVRRLLDPAALGGYLVTVLGKGVDTSLQLGAMRDLRPPRATANAD